ncbi:MAG: zinc ABC transporter substrate-binding protein [Alcanivoracaceae bacterium]|nr:zinc ABC transporter substrate-binding protein [Alcanivoracaceae bacterium]
MRYLLITMFLLASLPARAALEVLACEPEWGALVEDLADDRARITVATSATQDPHRVQARPSLISAARRADLVVCTGADLEVGWLPVLLNKGANPRIRQAPGLFYAADHVTLVDIPDSVSRSDGDVHAAGNPHFYMDPRRVLEVGAALSQRLAELDPDNSEAYQAAWAAMQTEWRNSLATLSARAAPLQGMEVVVHHKNFRYLEEWLGIKAIASLEPRPGIPPSPGTLQGVLDTVRNSAAELVLYTHYNGDDAARWLADHSTLCALELPLTVGAEPGTDTLMAFYHRLVDEISRARRECAHE